MTLPFSESTAARVASWAARVFGYGVGPLIDNVLDMPLPFAVLVLLMGVCHMCVLAIVVGSMYIATQRIVHRVVTNMWEPTQHALWLLVALALAGMGGCIVWAFATLDGTTFDSHVYSITMGFVNAVHLFWNHSWASVAGGSESLDEL